MGLGVPLVRSRVPGLHLVDQCGLRRDTAPKAWPTPMAECTSPPCGTTCRVEEEHGPRMSPRCFAPQEDHRLHTARLWWGMQLRHHRGESVPRAENVINSSGQVRPIPLGSLYRPFVYPLTREWFKSDTHVCPMALLLGVIPEWARASREEAHGPPLALGRHCVPPYVGTLWVLRFC